MVYTIFKNRENTYDEYQFKIIYMYKKICEQNIFFYKPLMFWLWDDRFMQGGFFCEIKNVTRHIKYS